MLSYFVIFRNSFSLTTWHDILKSTLTRSNQYYLTAFAWHLFDNNVISIVYAVKHITFDIKMLFSDFYFWARRVASGDTFPFLHRHLGAGCDWELELKCWKTRKSPFLSNFPLIVLQLEMWIEMDWFEPLLQLMKTLSESSKGANSLFSFQHNCYIVWGAWVLKAIKNVMWWLKMFWNLWSLLTQTGLPGVNWLSVTSPSLHLLWPTEPLRISREALDSFS